MPKAQAQKKYHCLVRDKRTLFYARTQCLFRVMKQMEAAEARKVAVRLAFAAKTQCFRNLFSLRCHLYEGIMQEAKMAKLDVVQADLDKLASKAEVKENVDSERQRLVIGSLLNMNAKTFKAKFSGNVRVTLKARVDKANNPLPALDELDHDEGLVSDELALCGIRPSETALLEDYKLWMASFTGEPVKALQQQADEFYQEIAITSELKWASSGPLVELNELTDADFE